MTEGVMSLISREEELYVEYMDTKRFPFETVIGPFEKLLSQKYRGAEFDAIISCDDNAFRFLQLRHKSIFSGVPVVLTTTFPD